MSFTTTNMCARPIWGFDQPKATVTMARRAGWSRLDLAWERLSEAACEAWLAGEHAPAARLIGRAGWLARLGFGPADPRRATALANLAIVGLYRRRPARAHRRLARALTLWDRSMGPAIEAMEIAPRARSSLFHLRMELKHRATYHANLRLRLDRFAAETRETMAALASGAAVPHRHISRWNGERPPLYDDSRKLLGACLLLAC